MKKFTFLLMAAIFAAMFNANAQSGTCGDNLTWNLSDGTLTISGTGDMWNYFYYNRNSVSWYQYLSQITTVVIEDGVTSIGNYNFYGCSGLTSVTIPNSVTLIGDGSFANCTILTTIEIPNFVTSIGDYAFGWCYLTSVTIPNSVTSIESTAFGGCWGLTSINVDVNNLNYSSIDGILYTKLQDVLVCCPAGKVGQVTIPNSVISIGNNAFDGCIGLTSVTIPNFVTSIGNNAFNSCAGLTSIIIPTSVTSIGEMAFGSCQGLISVTIPNSITSIESDVFYNCIGLTSVTISNSVTYIGSHAFFYCRGLTSVTCKATTPPTIYDDTFSYIGNNTMFYVPCESEEDYQAAEFWSTLNYGQCITAGINDIKTIELNIYPNPATDIVTIDGINANETVIITDLSGRIVGRALPLHNGWQTINVSGLPSGVYLVRVGNNIGKLVKE